MRFAADGIMHFKIIDFHTAMKAYFCSFWLKIFIQPLMEATRGEPTTKCDWSSCHAHISMYTSAVRSPKIRSGDHPRIYPLYFCFARCTEKIANPLVACAGGAAIVGEKKCDQSAQLQTVVIFLTFSTICYSISYSHAQNNYQN